MNKETNNENVKKICLQQKKEKFNIMGSSVQEWLCKKCSTVLRLLDSHTVVRENHCGKNGMIVHQNSVL